MNNTDEINNEEKRICHHNLRKNRKPRSYDFEYFDESLNKPKGKRRGRKRGRKPQNALNVINKSTNSVNVEERTKRRYNRKKIKDTNICEQESVEKGKNEDFILHKNENVVDNKIVDVPKVRTKGRRRKKKDFNMNQNMHLFHSNVRLRNGNIKIDRVCEYLTYKTNTTWRYMGSTVKFKLVDDQQEKYIFLKNMKKHIIFEIIKIAMFALLKVNLNDNNIYTLHKDREKRHIGDCYNKRRDIRSGNNYQVGKNAGNNCLSSIVHTSIETHSGKNINSNNDHSNRTSHHHHHQQQQHNHHHNKNKCSSGKGDLRYAPNPNLATERSVDQHQDNYTHCGNREQCKDGISRARSNSLKNKSPRESVMSVLTQTHYDDTVEDIDKRLEEKNDILNQGVTVSEILDFVKEKYEKHYESVKQYIVTALNIYCALNIFKLIRRGRYSICRFEHFNIFKVKYFKKYYKFFYTLKGEEEILMNIKNYLKSFYFGKLGRKPRSIVNGNVAQSAHTNGINHVEKDDGVKKRGRGKPRKNQKTSLQMKENLENHQLQKCTDSVVIKEEQIHVNNSTGIHIPEKNSIIESENVVRDIINHSNNEDNTKVLRKNSNIYIEGRGVVQPDHAENKNDLLPNALVNDFNIVRRRIRRTKNNQKEPKVIIKRKRRSKPNNHLTSHCDEEKVKNFRIDLNKVNIKCIKVVYGIKHFFCSYDTKGTNDEDFEIIKVQKKYDMLRKSSVANMNLRYNLFNNSKRLLNKNNNNQYNNNENPSVSTKNLLLRNNNGININMNVNKDEQQITKQPQYGKQKKQNYEDDVAKHEKYNYVNFNLSYKTLRKKMICVRHYVSTTKKEERTFKQKYEPKTKDKTLAISNDSLVKTCSINSNLSNIVSVDGLSSMNFESHGSH
ncbi:hypothetical protein, conserved [Plasmodium gonderi]|uniref:Uncharacterized protein n=1 Tax=Plasmodium gonderi TaxID=77519 RepID=A0A1Y1JGU1_PLAGO|nr:hypothetical protein, conserved [Plasmodium gonderi]GAW80555.1 hypothetical protein, conserved [Plasmodium gonderi]